VNRGHRLVGCALNSFYLVAIIAMLVSVYRIGIFFKELASDVKQLNANVAQLLVERGAK